MNEVIKLRSGYYRVSVKALIFDDNRSRFLLVQDSDGTWELPGGGLDWEETPQEGLARELKEEMGIDIVSISNQPSYFVTMERHAGTFWTANVIYETKLEHVNFVISDECIAIKFVNKEEALQLDITVPAKKFLEVFSPSNHS